VRRTACPGTLVPWCPAVFKGDCRLYRGRAAGDDEDSNSSDPKTLASPRRNPETLGKASPNGQGPGFDRLVFSLLETRYREIAATRIVLAVCASAVRGRMTR